MRPSQRSNNQLRTIKMERNYLPYAEGSCFIQCGNTHVLCVATVEERVPVWLRNSGKGWITAEYSMLPRATLERTKREVVNGKPSGRTQEIQRLIGRSLRAVVDLKCLNERQITIDCDVIRADGGTRTTAITGAWVALHDALMHMTNKKIIKKNPLIEHVAAISCGLYKGEIICDLDYTEDSNAQADANFVLAQDHRLIEIQATAEKNPFSRAHFDQMFLFAQNAVSHLINMQKNAIES